jgi:hypothetical protein
MADGRKSAIGPGKLRAARGAVLAAAAIVASAAGVASASCDLTTGGPPPAYQGMKRVAGPGQFNAQRPGNTGTPQAVLNAVASAKTSASCDLSTNPVKKGRVPVVGPQKFRPTYASQAPVPPFSADAAGNANATCALTTFTPVAGAAGMAQQSNLGPSLANPFNVGQFVTRSSPPAPIPPTTSDAVARAFASCALTTAIPVGANAYGIASASSSLAGAAAIVASGQAKTAATCALTTGIAIAADAQGKASSACNVGGGAVFAANASAATAATCALTVGAGLQAQASAKTWSACDLTTGAGFVGRAGGVASATCDLSGAAAISAAASAKTQASADLTTAIPLYAAAAGRAVAACALDVGTGLTSVAAGRAAAYCDLSTGVQLSADAIGRTSTQVSLGHVYLVGGPRWRIERPTRRNFAIRNYPEGSNSGVADVNLRFDEKGPPETIPLEFDFTNDLNDGEVMTGVTNVTIATVLGVDAGPSLTVVSFGLDATAKKIIAYVSGGLNECDYRVVAIGPSSASPKLLDMVGVLPVRTSA